MLDCMASFQMLEPEKDFRESGGSKVSSLIQPRFFA
jgi:hypothetical protein